MATAWIGPGCSQRARSGWTRPHQPCEVPPEGPLQRAGRAPARPSSGPGPARARPWAMSPCSQMRLAMVVGQLGRHLVDLPPPRSDLVGAPPRSARRPDSGRAARKIESPIVVATASAARPTAMASDVFRRHHRQTRSGAGIGRARIVSKFRNRSRSSASRQRRRVAALRAPSPGISGRSSPGRAGIFGTQAAWPDRAPRSASLCSVSSGSLRPERRSAGEHLVEDRPERIDVGGRAGSRTFPVACSGDM